MASLYPIFCSNSWSKKKSSTNLLEPGRINKAKNRRKLPLLNSNTQYAIDAGQKNFDAIRCNKCNMLYTKGELFDEKQHRTHHDLVVNGVKFSGWKNERLIRYFENGSKIIVVSPNDPKHMIKKVNEICELADSELGISMDAFSSMEPSSRFLIYLTDKKRIGGFVAAEEIKEAFEIISDQGMVDSKKIVPAKIGIARLWVHASYRKKGIATLLLDTLREKFIPYCIIKKTEIAFSDPTDDGRKFARKYLERDNFLVY